MEPVIISLKKCAGYKYFLISWLIIIFSANGFAQDIHFSMFNASPLFLNPANTGNFEGNWRLAGNYRDQWRAVSTPFTSASISFDKDFVVNNRKFAGGLYFLTDQSGAIGLTSNKLYLSGAYKKANEKSQLIFGLQAGLVFRSFGNGDLTFPSDYDHDAGEFKGDNSGEKRMYPDINAGVIWKTNVTIFEPEVGIAFSHLNSPNESFYDAKEALPVKFCFHGKLKTKLSDQFYVQPAILVLNQKTAHEMMFGTNVGFKSEKRRSNVKEIFAGIYLRDGYFKNSDAITIMGGATVGRTDIMIGYDYNVSGLKTATSNKGAFEISFIFKNITTVLNTYSIPCERF